LNWKSLFVLSLLFVSAVISPLSAQGDCVAAVSATYFSYENSNWVRVVMQVTAAPRDECRDWYDFSYMGGNRYATPANGRIKISGGETASVMMRIRPTDAEREQGQIHVGVTKGHTVYGLFATPTEVEPQSLYTLREESRGIYELRVHDTVKLTATRNGNADVRAIVIFADGTRASLKYAVTLAAGTYTLKVKRALRTGEETVFVRGRSKVNTGLWEIATVKSKPPA
jgi:hypothetical protein